MHRSHVCPSRQVMRDANNACTRSHIVYRALLPMLLLNLVVFIALNISESRRSTKKNVHLVANVRPGNAPVAGEASKFEPRLEQLEGRRFMSLDERLKKYAFKKPNKDIKINSINPKNLEARESFKKVSKRKKRFGSTKRGGDRTDLKEAQRQADDRNHRSIHYLRQIFGKNNDPNPNASHTKSLRNEDIRSKYLMVSGVSKNLNIWMHRVRIGDKNSGESYEYPDGIEEQLNYVPESYKSNLKRLNLSDRYSKSFSKKQHFVLSNYLKNELASMVNSPRPNTDFYNSAHKATRSIGILQSAIAVTSKIPKSPLRKEPDWSMLVKIIYLPDGLSADVGYGRSIFISEECPVSSCYLTSKNFFKRRAHLRVERMYAIETVKPPGQIWLNWFLESPVNSVYLPQNTYDDRINWTASFRSDSTIVTPYAKFVPHLHRSPEDSTHKNYAEGKTRFAAWFVSSCYTTNNRMDFVKRLQKHISVDVFGACGFLDCDKSNKTKCFELLSRRYKFYLSFENSNCDYYITEKFFLNALQNNVVPVVMGARREDYLKAAPPNSFVHVEDFKDERELAEYLKLLNKNDTEYNKYFEWKSTGSFVNTKFWCRLCTLLQDDHKPNLWYSNFEEWWMSRNTCKEGPWNT